MTMTVTSPPPVQSQAIYNQTVQELTGVDASVAETAVLSNSVPETVAELLEQYPAQLDQRNKVSLLLHRRFVSSRPVERLDYLLTTARLFADMQPFMNREEAFAWLQEPNEHLHHHTPLELLWTSTGERRVRGLLDSMSGGYYP